MKWVTFTWGVGLIVAVLFSIPITGGTATNLTQPSKEALQIEMAKERIARGPWKQVVAIESMNEEGSYVSGIGRTNSSGFRRPNHNLIAFLDEKRVAILDGANPTRIFDSETGKPIKSFGESLSPEMVPRELASSRDGRFLMVLPNSEPKIWDTDSGRIVGTLPPFEDQYALAAFYPDGRRLATYRGLFSRGGMTSGTRTNLQIWRLNGTNGFTLVREFAADIDARSLELVGPYLLVRGYRHSQVLDAETLEVLLAQPGDTDEEFMFLESSGETKSGRIAVIEYRPR